MSRQKVTECDVLERAAQVLQEDGWKQGQLHNGPGTQGPHCVLGAVEKACLDLGVIKRRINPYKATKRTLFGQVVERLSDALPKTFVGKGADGVWRYNDGWGSNASLKTKQGAIGFIRKAIKKAGCA